MSKTILKLEKLQNIEITDKEIIKKYMTKYDDFFIPANEHDTFDTDLLENDIIIKSADVIGQDNPIRVAICPNDKTSESSKFHIHLRIMDGRHRWKQSMKHNVIWATKFYDVKDYKTFMSIRAHLDSKKTITAREQEEYFMNLAEHYQDEGIEQQHICATIIKDFCPPFIPETIRRYLPYRFKNQTARRAGQKGKSSRYGENHYTVEEIIKKKPEQITTEIYGLKQTLKQKDEHIDFLLGIHGEKIPDIKQFYIVEKRRNLNNPWGLYSVSTDKKLALDIFNKNKSINVRLSMVEFVQNIIGTHKNQSGLHMKKSE